MDLITAIAILLNQSQDTTYAVGTISSQAIQMQRLIEQENSVPAIVPQIKAAIASTNGNMESLRAQITLLQQAVDQVASLAN